VPALRGLYVGGTSLVPFPKYSCSDRSAQLKLRLFKT
jgi:hypothetical protein